MSDDKIEFVKKQSDHGSGKKIGTVVAICIPLMIKACLNATSAEHSHS
jgi:hypothetical protein